MDLFKHEKEYYFKPVTVYVFWSNNYIEYETMVKIRYYQLKNIIIKLYHT